VFGVCAALGESAAFAQSAREILKSPDWARGAVVTDGAAVYKEPDFDAPVLEYLPYKTTVYLLKRPVAGRSGMGLFHRARYKNKAGYITDTDIRFAAKEIEKEKARQEEAKADKKTDKKTRSMGWEKEDEEAMNGQPAYFYRHVGLAIARVKFTEKFSGHKLSDQMWMGGLRASGPGVLFDGPPLDFNLWFSIQKPGYYKRITSEPVSGYMLFGDIMPMLPLFSGMKNVVYYGPGLMWTYTSYKVNVKGQRYDSQEFRLGFDFGLGYGHRWGSVMLRADVKYYWEKTQYLGTLVSVQTEY
jgi:hypothetical protein